VLISSWFKERSSCGGGSSGGSGGEKGEWCMGSAEDSKGMLREIKVTSRVIMRKASWDLIFVLW